MDEWFFPINKVHLTIDDPHRFNLRPVLFPYKFPQHRPKEKLMALVTPQMRDRIARQDAARRLVFGWCSMENSPRQATSSFVNNPNYEL